MLRITVAVAMIWGAFVHAAPAAPVEIGSRLELFVDKHLVEKSKNIEFEMHAPVKQPLADSPLPVRHMMTIIKDDDKYRAYWRGSNPDYKGKTFTGHPGETVEYGESTDGIEWTFPNLGLMEIGGSTDNNTVLANMPPFLTGFVPFLDDRPGVPKEERFKALAGYPGHGNKSDLRGEELKGRGLHSFVSLDGLHWTNTGEVIPYQPGWRHAFDSTNVGFWSEAEQQYVCYFRTWQKPDYKIRSISRTTSKDFKHWTDPVAMDPNFPGEQLYTNVTTAYLRAPHIYISLPTRFVTGRGDSPNYDPKDVNSTDIMLMSTRAGSNRYDRLIKEAFIRPGLSLKQWGNRANYATINMLMLKPEELSIYHRSGHRYTLRTDGFVSVSAGAELGQLLTKPITFEGGELVLNMSTSAAGDVRVELLDIKGKPIEGFTAEDCVPVIGDAIERTVVWNGGEALTSLAGKPVRLRFLMKEADLYSFRFR